jgi:hypothetical protein
VFVFSFLKKLETKYCRRERWAELHGPAADPRGPQQSTADSGSGKSSGAAGRIEDAGDGE